MSEPLSPRDFAEVVGWALLGVIAVLVVVLGSVMSETATAPHGPLCVSCCEGHPCPR